MLGAAQSRMIGGDSRGPESSIRREIQDGTHKAIAELAPQ